MYGIRADYFMSFDGVSFTKPLKFEQKNGQFGYRYT